MLIASRKSLLLLALAATACKANQAPATPAIALTPYTASDQSASAGVPSGWQVTQAANTFIQMTGPQGETVSLGNTIVAKNAAFQPGQRGASGIDLSMPYTAPLAQKLTMLYQQGAALSGKPLNQFTVTSSTPLQLPATIGQCGRFVATFTDQKGPEKLLAVFCSLPLDATSTYKNIMITATAPAATAAQSAPIAQAIFQSYRIPPAWLQKKLAPFGAPPPSAAGTLAAAAAINRSTAAGIAGSNNSANCFDLGVIRQTPTYLLPRSCGGTKPD